MRETKYVEKHVAGIATDDEEGGEEEQGPEGDEELAVTTPWSIWGGDTISHNVELLMIWDSSNTR